MNGAEAVLKTLADAGVEVCFADPGASDTPTSSAFDRETRIRPVPTLFEGVATGAADGYGRIAERPACTLLHFGPGLSHGSANLHNARRAMTPLVNLVEDHATHHRPHDAPLNADIEALARPHSVWVKSADCADLAPALAAEAVAASGGPPGGVATLILPADTAWTDLIEPRPPSPPLRRAPLAVAGKAVDVAARALRAASRPMLLLGTPATSEQALAAAGRIAGKGVRIMIDTVVARQPRGAGRFAPDKMFHSGELALADLAGVDLMVLVGTRTPVASFAFPALPSVLAPEGCAVLTLSAPHEDSADALEALADALGAPKSVSAQSVELPATPRGDLSAYTIGASVARWAPDGAIVCDDAASAGLPVYMQSRGARPHDWLFTTGGAVGQAVPLAIGAAVAAPGRKVLSLNGDGAAAHALQGLWTIASEGLDVTTVILTNPAPGAPSLEQVRTRSARPDRRARAHEALEAPRLDWVSLAKGFGVPAVRVSDAETFDAALARSFAGGGPALIVAVLS